MSRRSLSKSSSFTDKLLCHFENNLKKEKNYYKTKNKIEIQDDKALYKLAINPLINLFIVYKLK